MMGWDILTRMLMYSITAYILLYHEYNVIITFPRASNCSKQLLTNYYMTSIVIDP